MNQGESTMTGRHELESKLKGEALVRKGLLKKHSEIPQLRLVPGTSMW